MKILAKLRQAVIHCNVNLRGLGTDEPHRHVLEQPVEALESLNPVVSLRHIGSIIDLDDMTKGFAEISAGGGRYFGRPDTAASQGHLGTPTDSCVLSTS